MNRKARGRWFALFVGLVFSAGVATGLLLRQYLEPTPAAAGQPPLFQGPAASNAGIGVLAKELDLTEAQQRQLETIFIARRQKLGTFREELRSRFEEQRAEAVAEIKRILTPEQQRRFETFVSRMPDRERPFAPGRQAIPPSR